jgi:lipopolysaccharide transport system ATP-binding protein
MVQDGPAHAVVNEYLGTAWKVTAERVWGEGEEAPGNHVVRLRRVRARDRGGATAESLDIRSPVGIELTYDVLVEGEVLTPKIELFNEEGTALFSAHDVGERWRYRPRPAGRYVSTVWIPGNYLAEGNLRAHASIVSHTPATVLHAHAPNAVGFQVVDSQQKDSARGDYVGPIPGLVRPLLDWTTEFDAGSVAEAAVPETVPDTSESLEVPT